MSAMPRQLSEPPGKGGASAWPAGNKGLITADIARSLGQNRHGLALRQRRRNNAEACNAKACNDTAPPAAMTGFYN
jgi:hypothetical protein